MKTDDDSEGLWYESPVGPNGGSVCLQECMRCKTPDRVVLLLLEGGEIRCSSCVTDPSDIFFIVVVERLGDQYRENYLIPAGLEGDLLEKRKKMLSRIVEHFRQRGSKTYSKISFEGKEWSLLN